MKKLRFIAIPILFLIGCEKDNACTDIGCNYVCENGYIIDENGCQTCECIEIRSLRIPGNYHFKKIN